jgi:hypothetical protein
MMDWNDIKTHRRLHPMPGTSKSNARNRELVARRLAKSEKNKSSQLQDTDKVLALMQNRITNAEFSLVTDDGQITLKRRRDIVDGYKELLGGLNATHFVTFMPGRFVKPETLAANIIKFCCRLERKALGKKWFKCTRDRIRLVGFLEKPDITPHYHAFMRVPSTTMLHLDEFGEEIWNTLMPAGKFDVRLIDSVQRVLSYTVKDLHHYWSPENVVIYKPNSPK